MVRIIDNFRRESQDFYRSSQNLFQLLGIVIDEHPEIIIAFLENHGIALTEYPDDTELVDAVIYGLEKNNSAFNAELSNILNSQLLEKDEDHYLSLRGELFKKPGHLKPMPIPPFRPPIKPRPIRPMTRPMVKPEPMKPLAKPTKPVRPMKPMVKPSKPVISSVKPTTSSPNASSVKPTSTPISTLVNQVSNELPKNDNLKDKVKEEALKTVKQEKVKTEKRPKEEKEVKEENKRKPGKKVLTIIGAVTLITISGFVIWKIRKSNQ